MQEPQPDANKHHHTNGSRHTLMTGADTAGQLSLVSWTLPPFWTESQLHQHATHSEVCYVLAGALAVTVGDQTHILRTGESTFVPQRTLHTLWNPTAATTIVLLIATPAYTEAE